MEMVRIKDMEVAMIAASQIPLLAVRFLDSRPDSDLVRFPNPLDSSQAGTLSTLTAVHEGSGFCGLGHPCMHNLIGQG